MRRFLILAVAVIVSGAVSAAAAIGLCAAMPCCMATDPVIKAAEAGCCSTVNCTEDPPALRESTLSVKQIETPTAVIDCRVESESSSLHDVNREAAPPPRTQQRLSTLSLLLI